MKNTSWIGTITLNASIDQHITVENLVKDDANRATNVINYPGGKGINVSKVVAELGGDTCAYTLLGGLPGALLKDLVKKIGIPLCSIDVKGDTRINTILTDVKDKSQTRISAPGPRMGLEDMVRFKRFLLSAKRKPAFWALGGSLPPGLSPECSADLIRFLQKHGTPCILDADGDTLSKGLRAKPFMIKPNEHEMRRLTGKRLSTVPEYLAAAEQVVQGGVKLVIVSLGARGALFVTRDEAFHATTPKVKVKSKVGAGDSLIGGVIYGLSQGYTLREAAVLGIAASTSAVMREAPRLCLRSDIAPLSRRVRLRDLH